MARSEQQEDGKSFEYSYIVPWVDTDAMGIVHFSNYFRLCERTEQAFMHHLGIRHKDIFLPRVHATCDYRYPMKFNQNAKVVMKIEEIGKRHITFKYEIMNETEAKLSAVCKIVVVPVLGDMKPAKGSDDLMELMTRYVIRK